MCILVLMTLYFQNTSDLHATSYMYVGSIKQSEIVAKPRRGLMENV